MKNYILLIITILSLVIVFSCNKKRISENPETKEMEEYIRNAQDKRAQFTFAQYDELLQVLSDSNIIVLPINEFKDSINDNKVMVGLRHDIDCHPYKALELARMEQKYGMRSSYYVLSTANYYGKFIKNGINRFQCMDTIYKQISALGCEIGIHNDLLVVMIKHGLDPLNFSKDENKYFNSIGIDINGSVAHGSDLASKTIPNFKIFSEYADSSYVHYMGKAYKIGEYSMLDYGYGYEANFVNHNKEYSDSGGDWLEEGGLNQVIDELKNSKAGARITILAHPVWWGKKAE